MKKPEFENVVYICHPYGGLNKNKNKVRDLMNTLVIQYPNFLFVSGVNSFDHAYFDVDHQKGMEMCYWLLDKCDEMWVYGDWEKSRGCKDEIEYCKHALIPIFYKEV